MPSAIPYFNPHVQTAVRRAHWDESRVTSTLKQGERVNVKISPMHIFLTRDGTVISVHPTPNLLYTYPITKRLATKDTLLRLTADPSLMVQSLLDLGGSCFFRIFFVLMDMLTGPVADSALEVVEEYHSKLLTLEHSILLKPDMSAVKDRKSSYPVFAG